MPDAAARSRRPAAGRAARGIAAAHPRAARAAARRRRARAVPAAVAAATATRSRSTPRARGCTCSRTPPAGLKLLADYYISVGKSGIEKAVEGDLRTPLGVYYVTSNLDPKSLKDFYGAGALPINYPNPYDARRGKTGSGIWLHGTPPDQFSRAPKATDGCVVLANPDLERIIRTVEVRTTPVVIAAIAQLGGAAASCRPRAERFADVLQAWRSAKASGDVDRLLAFYTPDFAVNGKTLAEWTPLLQGRARAARAAATSSSRTCRCLRWTDSADTMVVTFGEVPAGARTGPVKRQYWVRQGAQWKIFFEGVIG